MNIIRFVLAFLARFFISSVFLAEAVSKIIHWHEAEKNLMNVLCDWQSYIGFSETGQDCLTALIPWTPFILILSTLFELVGGLLILLGVREKLGAFLLLIFFLPMTILMHQFWFAEGASRELQTLLFLKNFAIMGGLILILLQGMPQVEARDDLGLPR